MLVRSSATSFRTLDGLYLAGPFVEPDEPCDLAVVLVHGGGVTREEGGFFTRLAAGLGAAGVASLRFDLRGHGESEGRQEELTLSAILNDIRVALAHAREVTGATRLSLIGQSFGGGICGYYAAKRPGEVNRLVLLCPQFNYKKRTIDSRPYWTDDYLSDDMAQQLSRTPCSQRSAHRRLSSTAPWTRSCRSSPHAKRSPASQLSTSWWRSRVPSTASPCTTTRSTSTRRVKSGRHS
jgi:pimeloyl-ACP methyl ester carboxylesterase